MNLSSVIAAKDKAAKYMLKEITHICKNMEKRSPGSEGERQACEYMAKVLKEDCGCERVEVESFKENPGSFYGWIYITISAVLLAFVLYFFAPAVSIALVVFGLALAFIQFGLYKKCVDKLFPEKTGHNVTAVKKCSGETKRRIIFNGHPDAAWEWPVNYALGGVGFEGHAIICGVGAVYLIVISILKLANPDASYIKTLGLTNILGISGAFDPFFTATNCVFLTMILVVAGIYLAHKLSITKTIAFSAIILHTFISIDIWYSAFAFSFFYQ